MIDRARKLQPLVRELADRAERERHLPAEIAQALAREGLYRIAAPRWCGGSEADPMSQIAAIEAISEADGSAGWNLMIGIESFGLVGPAFASCPELADPAVILCSSTAAMGRADEVPGGVRLTGRWQFVSGCHNSAFFGGLCTVHRDGDPIRSGVFALVPRAEFRIEDTWNVAGLRGSGSHDVTLEDVFVPDARVGGQFGGPGVAGRTARDDEYPLLRFPLGSRLAYNKVGVGFGIARAAIDAFIDLASGKLPRFSGKKLQERPFAQRAVAHAEARLRSARAFVFEQVEEMWQTVCSGSAIELHDRALLQIACSDAARSCAEAVDTVCEAAGTTANQIGCPLERQLRDVRVIRQHFTVAPHHIEDAGRILLGLPPEGVMLALQQ